VADPEGFPGPEFTILSCQLTASMNMLFSY
jgi:hypothetical protein